MHKLKLVLGEYDWMATRLTPRKYFPPRQSKGKENQAEKPRDSPLPADGGIRRFSPEDIQIPGAQGFGVKVSKIQGVRCLVLMVATPNPFHCSVRSVAKGGNAAWNQHWNTWDFPILSQTKGNALKEIWYLIEEAFFEVMWTTGVLELHWHYQISDQNLKALEKRISSLNNFWETGSLDHDPPQVDLVYGGLERLEVEVEALKEFQNLQPLSKWVPTSEESLNRLCVNYLRHRQSSYYLLLKSDRTYLQVFAQINRAIAQAYPWLQNEAERQIALKKGELN